MTMQLNDEDLHWEEPVGDSAHLASSVFNPAALDGIFPELPPLRAVALRMSVMLPLIIAAFASFALAAGIVMWMGTQGGGAQVPVGVIEQQAEIAHGASESVRKSLNGAINDLEQFGALQWLDTDPQATFDANASRFLKLRERYTSLTLVDGESDATSRIDRDVTRDGNGLGTLTMFVPVPIDAESLPNPHPTLVAGYDVGFLDFALGVIGTTRGWVVDRTGAIVASTVPGSSGSLPSADLRRAAERATTSGPGAFVTAGSYEYAEIIAYSPVTGDGPGGQAALFVVTSRPVATMQIAAVDQRFKAWVVAASVVIMMMLILTWLYAKIVGPLRSLRRDAHTLASGELRLPVSIQHDDEIGATARSMEQIRLSMRALSKQITGDRRRSDR
jgi:HAMP domain-containing protein